MVGALEVAAQLHAYRVPNHRDLLVAQAAHGLISAVAAVLRATVVCRPQIGRRSAKPPTRGPLIKCIQSNRRRSIRGLFPVVPLNIYKCRELLWGNRQPALPLSQQQAFEGHASPHSPGRSTHPTCTTRVAGRQISAFSPPPHFPSCTCTSTKCYKQPRHQAGSVPGCRHCHVMKEQGTSLIRDS